MGRRKGTKLPAVHPTATSKRCSMCREIKPHDQFAARKSGMLLPRCKMCESRAVLRHNWKRRLETEGEGPLLARLEHAAELAELLRRWRAGEDMINWT